MAAYVRSALAREWTEDFAPTRGVKPGRFLIVGGGPSLKRSLGAIKKAKKKGFPVLAVNAASRYLVDHGVVPDVVACLDPHPIVEDLIVMRDDITYLVASQCSPQLFDALEGKRVVLWHGYDRTYPLEEILAKSGRRWVTVGGGRTTALRAITIGYLMGYRDLHVYGCDTSVAGGEHHAYEQAHDDHEPIDVLECEGREYPCKRNMIGQAYDYINQIRHWGHLYKVTVHGSGLLPWVDQKLKEGYPCQLVVKTSG